MIHYSVLGSGSNGNSYLFRTKSSALLIDAGFSLKEIAKRIQQVGSTIEAVGGLCLTHLHPDHSRGAGVFARRQKKPVWLHEKLVQTQDAELLALAIPDDLLNGFVPGAPFTVGEFSITSFPTSHDSPFSVGFAIHVGGRQITVITDTGTIPVEAHALIQQSDVLFMEANYDETMLLRGPYPPFLKKRIAGKQGHLSNNEVIELLNKCPPLPHAKLYFCHLSKVNNHPKVLAQECEKELQWKGSTTICHNGELYEGYIERSKEKL